MSNLWRLQFGLDLKSLCVQLLYCCTSYCKASAGQFMGHCGRLCRSVKQNHFQLNSRLNRPAQQLQKNQMHMAW